MRGRNSFSSANAKISTVLKESYMQQEFFVDIAITHETAITNKNHYIFPKIDVKIIKTGIPASLLRTSTSRLLYKPHEETKAPERLIDITRIFDTKDDQSLTHVLITSTNSLDNSLLVQKILYAWANQQLWGNFQYLFAIDLQLLLESEINVEDQFLNMIPRLIYLSLGSDKVSESQILDIITRQASKTLIILNNYDKVSTSQSHKMQAFLKLAAKYNILLTSSNKAAYTLEDGELSEKLTKFSFHTQLENKGLSHSSMNKYLKHVSIDRASFNEYQNFLRLNEDFLELSRSPSILQMLYHLWSASKKITNTQLYNKLYSMILSIQDEQHKQALLSLPSLIEFKKALDIKDLLMSHDYVASLSQIAIISNNEKNIQILKFVVGLIVLERHEAHRTEAILSIFDMILLSNQTMLKISGNKTTFLMMSLFSEVIKNTGNDSLIPDGLKQYIDGLILQDIHRWSDALIKSGYNSPAIIMQLQSMLESGNKQNELMAMKILPFIEIYITQQKNAIILAVITKIQSQNAEIAEAAITALQYITHYPGVKEALLDGLSNAHINIKIIAIKALAKIADHEVVFHLNKLLESSDYWIISSVLEAYQEIYLLSEETREDIKESLFMQLSDRSIDKEIIFEKILVLLKDLQHEPHEIVALFTRRFNDSLDYQKLDKIIEILKNLSKYVDVELKQGISHIFLDKLELLKTSGLISYFVVDRHYSTRSKLQEALGDLFIYNDEATKNRIYSAVKIGVDSKDDMLSCVAIRALVKISAYNKEESFSLLIKNLVSSKALSRKIAAIESLEKIYDQLSTLQKEEIVTMIHNLISTSSDDALLISSINFLNIIDLPSFTQLLPSIATKILKLISENHNMYLVKSSIDFLGAVFQYVPDLKIPIFDLLVFRIVNPRVTNEQSDITKVLLKIYDSLSSYQKTSILNILHDLHERSPISELKIIFNHALSSLETSAMAQLYGIKVAKLPLFIPLKDHSDNIDTIDYLIRKYSTSLLALSIEDQIKLNSLFEPILTLLLYTENPLIYSRMLSIIKKAEYSDQQVLNVLSSNIISDKYIKKLANIFEGNIYLIEQAELLLPLDSSKQIFLIFPNIKQVVEHLEAFVEYVEQNHIEIRLTRESISFDGKIFLFAHQVSNIESYLKYVKKIFIAFSGPHNKVIKSFEEGSIVDVFEDIDHIHIEGDNIKLSILHSINSKGSKPNHVFLIIEYQTIFGDILIKKIALDHAKLAVSIHTNLEDNYKTLVFGKHSEHLHYYIGSFIITADELTTIIQSSKTWVTQEDLFSNTLIILSERTPQIEKYNWSKGTLVSHDMLINYQALEERMTVLEHKFIALEANLRTEMHKLNVHQKTIDKIVHEITTHLKALDRLEIPKHLSIYQQNLFLEIVQGLNALHMAAMVVQTSMVQNSQQGIAAGISSVLGNISPHIPIAGAALNLFTSFLQVFDAKFQDSLSKKIADLAADPVDMAHLAKAIALKIVTHSLNIQEVHAIKDSIAFKIHELTTSVDLDIIRKALDAIEGLFTPEDEASRASKDAQDILSIITGFLATGECTLSLDWSDNYKKLDNFLLDNHILELTLIIGSTDSYELSFSPNSLMIDASSPLKGLMREVSASSQSSTLTKSSYYDDLIRQRRSSEDYDAEYPGFYSCLPSTSKFLLLEDQKFKANIPHIGVGDIGFVVTNGIEVIPSAKYLLSDYIPILPFINNWQIVQAIAPYEHFIYSAIYTAGNAVYTYYNPETGLYSSVANTAYIAKPYLYQYRSQFMSYLDEEGYNEATKLGVYIASDSLLSAVSILPAASLLYSSAVPLMTLLPLAAGYAVLQGLSIGSINYYNSKPHESSLASSAIAKFTTTGTLYSCYQVASSVSDPKISMMTALSCVPAAASMHYYSKYYGDVAYDLWNNIMGDSKPIAEED